MKKAVIYIFAFVLIISIKTSVYAESLSQHMHPISVTSFENEDIIFMNESESISVFNKIKASRGSVSFSPNAVSQYASKFVGIPYRWGGTNPSTGFDCSGFTQYVYKNFGVNIGRTTYSQICSGVPVEREELRNGDLVFFGKNSKPHHVGIYVGNNCYIHSPRTGETLKVSPMIRKDYMGARRIR